jgi:hypothetical protein
VPAALAIAMMTRNFDPVSQKIHLKRPDLFTRPVDGNSERALCVPKIRFCNIGDEGRQGQVVM